MPMVFVYGFPHAHVDPGDLGTLDRMISQRISKITELKLTEDDVSVIIPQCYMFGSHDEIFVIIDGLFDKPERTSRVRQELAKAVAEEVAKFFYEDGRSWQMVEVFVRPPFDPNNSFAVLRPSDISDT